MVCDLMIKVLFLENMWHEKLGIMTLSSILKENGHKCDIFIGDGNKIINYLEKTDPDVIAFSCMNIQYEWVKNTCKNIKNAGFKIPIIVGGPHPTFFPEIIKDQNINMICLGEGEYSILELADKIERGEEIKDIKNIWIKTKNSIHRNELRPLIEDLDELPFPDREIYKKYNYFRKNPYEIFSASRGCPFNCSFCYNHAKLKLYLGKGKYVRWRSVKNIIEEIKLVNEKIKVKAVMFIDDTFNLNNKWAISFLEEYKDEIDIPFSCNVRAELVNEELVKTMSKCNCLNIRFAIETGNEKLRNGVLRKNITNDEIIRAARLFQKYQIEIITFNMFGLPGETLNNAWETIELNQQIKPNAMDFEVFMPYPNLELTNYAIKNGFMKIEDLEKLSVGKYRVFRSILKQKDINDVCNLHKFSLIASRYPRLRPIINNLIKLPQNFIFEGVYGITQAYNFMKWTKDKKRIITDIIKNFKQLT
jgi:radical SAM superfamily enzyme YgiQ (UPF0313 family)